MQPSPAPKTAADLLSRVLGYSKSSSPGQSPLTLSPHPPHAQQHTPETTDSYTHRLSPRLALQGYDEHRRSEGSPIGVIGQGRASPRRTESGNASPRWSGGFGGF